MALAYGSAHRLDRILARIGSSITFAPEDKVIALQNAAMLYDLYDGNGSETTYTDRADLTPLQAELIATVAAIDLVAGTVLSYQSNVQSTTAGPVSVTYRSDTLNWLNNFLDWLKLKKKSLEDNLGMGDITDDVLPGLFINKVGACCDPSDNPCSDDFTDEASKA